MGKEIIFIIIGVIIGLIIGYLISKLYFWKQSKYIKKQAVARSRASIMGETNEKIAPLLKNFPYYKKDMVFIGKGIDYIVFDGLSNNELKQIIFLEIKYGKSTLNKNEKSIKEVVDKNKVKYELMKL